jgi:hypothetical protein
MSAHLLDPPLPVRLSRHDGSADRFIKAHKIRRREEGYIVESHSGEGYYYLPRPSEWDDDGVPVVCWADDATTSHEWVVD